MFVPELFTNTQLKDYSLTLSPKSKSLDIQGEFQLESNFFIPSNVIELSYVFPFQRVDKLLLKTDGEKCQPSRHSLFCFVYKNFAQVNLADSANQFKGAKVLQIPIITQFGLNSHLQTGEWRESRQIKKFYWEISRQFENLSFQRKFEINLHPERQLSLSQENNLELTLTTKIELDKYEPEKYSSQKLHLRVPNLQEMLDKGVLLSYTLAHQPASFRVNQLFGKFRGKAGKMLESFAVTPVSGGEIILKKESIDNLRKYGDELESIEVDIHLSSKKDTKIVSLQLQKNTKLQEDLMIQITPDDELFKEIFFDNS